jgi:hypothetical protein
MRSSTLRGVGFRMVRLFEALPPVPPFWLVWWVPAVMESVNVVLAVPERSPVAVTLYSATNRSGSRNS